MEEMETIKPLENINIAEVCRACFETCEQYKMLFDEADSIEKRTLGDVFFDVVKIEMKANSETPPSRICISCSNDLMSAYSFIQKSQKNNERLLQYLKNANIKKPDCLTEFPMDIPADQNIADFLHIKVEDEGLNDYNNDSMPDDRHSPENSSDSDGSDYEPLIQKKQKINKMQCTYCDRIFKRQDFLENHIKKHEADIKKKEVVEDSEDETAGKKRTCQECGFSCNSKLEMDDHKKAEHTTRLIRKKPETKHRRREWDPIKMEKALAAIKNKEMGAKLASKTFGVPRSTLRRIAMIGKPLNEHLNVSMGRKPILNTTLENELVMYLHEMETHFWHFTSSDICSMAFQMAQKYNLSHTFSLLHEKAGRDWLSSFLQRHENDLSFRQSARTRAKSIDKTKDLDNFFNILEELYQKYSFPPCRIWNVDETGLSIFPNKQPELVARKQKRKLETMNSVADDDAPITIINCMSAGGSFIPPYFIIPGERCNLRSLMAHAPLNSKAFLHVSGRVQLSIFTDWFRHFLKFAKPSQEQPMLLVLDGQYSFTKNIEVMCLAQQNHVVIVSLPTRCTQKIKPMDRTFKREIEKQLNEEVKSKHNLDNVQTIQIFKTLYLNLQTEQIAINGFKYSGIFPLNRNIYSESCESKPTFEVVQVKTEVPE